MEQVADHLEVQYDHELTSWGEALEFPSTRNLRQFTHRLFNRYPARSIALVPRSILTSLLERTNQARSDIEVLDPFMGSGTTAIEATLQGFRAYGVELDPFARLVAEVSTRAYKEPDLQRLKQLYTEITDCWESTAPDEDLYPALRNVEYWFSEENFENLLKLKTAIYEHSDAKKDLDFLRIVLADMIRPCSKAERQSLKPYISKKYPKTPKEVAPRFKKSFESHFEALREYSQFVEGTTKPVSWTGYDATDFTSSRQFDVAITSPPYINALDYVRCIKIESAWAGCADNEVLSDLRDGQVGDRPNDDKQSNAFVQKLINEYVQAISEEDQRRGRVVEGYFHDMLSNMRRVHSALNDGAEYHLVVGNSTIRGVEVPTHELIAQIGEIAGFEWSGYYKYVIKDHRTSIPRKGRGGKIKYEHVLTLSKAS